MTRSRDIFPRPYPAAASLLFAGLAATALYAGCNSSSRQPCEDDSECFVGEQCHDGACRPIPTISTDGGRDADSGTPPRDTNGDPVDDVADTTEPIDTAPDGSDTEDASDGAPDTQDGDGMRRVPKPGAGQLIWRHEFRDGMPAAFDHTADYPESGTWGRQDDVNGGTLYEPGSIQNEHLRLEGPYCTTVGVAYPTQIDLELQNWELFYRVDAQPGDDAHSNRIIGGIGAVGGEPQGSYQSDVDQMKRGLSGFVDKGATFQLNGWNAEGNIVELRASAGGIPIEQGEWYVRIATSKKRTKTWVKYWPADESEPSSWNLDFDAYLSGRPGFYVVGTCKPNSPPRVNSYRFYELREIGL